MVEIFEKYISKEFKADMSLEEAYAKIENIHKNWVFCNYPNKTIQEYVDEMCDELEAEGHDLEFTPTKVVGEKFMNLQFGINMPPEWKALKKAKDSLEIVLKSASNDQRNTLLETLESIEAQMKEHQ